MFGVKANVYVFESWVSSGKESTLELDLKVLSWGRTDSARPGLVRCASLQDKNLLPPQLREVPFSAFPVST